MSNLSNNIRIKAESILNIHMAEPMTMAYMISSGGAEYLNTNKCPWTDIADLGEVLGTLLESARTKILEDLEKLIEQHEQAPAPVMDQTSAREYLRDGVSCTVGDILDKVALAFKDGGECRAASSLDLVSAEIEGMARQSVEAMWQQGVIIEKALKAQERLEAIGRELKESR